MEPGDNLPEMHVLEIGRLLIPGVTYLPEGSAFEWGLGPGLLRISMHKPSPYERQTISREPVEFALYVDRDPQFAPIIFLLTRFGREQWMDSPYSIHLVTAEKRFLPWRDDPDYTWNEETRLKITIGLVDGLNGRLVVNPRIISWSPEFTHKWRELIEEQLIGAFEGSHAYNERISRVYGTMSSAQMAARAEAQCRGGS